jgi:hypothetical protein
MSDLLRRVQAEFLEMPGLRVTAPQARRLWGMEPATCAGVLAALVDAGFLTCTRDGAYIRSSGRQIRFSGPPHAA